MLYGFKNRGFGRVPIDVIYLEGQLIIYIAIIIGLFVFIYLATWSHWAVIAYLVGIALFLWFWIKKQKVRND